MIKMKKTQKDLFEACKARGFDWFEAVRAYAYRFKKYDDLTLREIDQVVAKLKKSHA